MKEKSSNTLSSGQERSGVIRRRAQYEHDYKAISDFKSLVVKFPSKIKASSQGKKSIFNFRNYSRKKSNSNNPTIAPTVTRISASAFIAGSDEDDSIQSFNYDASYAENANDSIPQYALSVLQ